ncbi:hypothetical protein NDU88_003654 [Pleurodeles waltl]|uniref:Uncharacterized protein n=1 Tax=Pleurodeles waltl TaxID=8319 RepID=A0AAV7NRG6_PLEWA|nr:hypothetical protein NDU88_003654 [Pleurodeles waltl]
MSKLFPACLAKIASGKFRDAVDKDKVGDEVKKNQDRVKARENKKRRYYVVFFVVWHAATLPRANLFCVLPAVAFSRALEREKNG